MIRKAAGIQGLLTIGVLVLFGRAGAAQPAPSWVRHGGDADAFDLVASPAGTVTIVGHGTLGAAGSFFEDVTADVDDSTSVAIATYAADGTLVWGRQGAFRRGPGEDYGSAIQGFVSTVDTQGNLYTSEGYPYFTDSNMLGSGGVSVNKYAPDGTARWSVPIHPPVDFPDDQPGFVVGLGVDAAERVYVGGFFRDTLILALDTLVAFPHEARADDDVFLASYDAGGTLRWSRRIGGPQRVFSPGETSPTGPLRLTVTATPIWAAASAQVPASAKGSPASVPSRTTPTRWPATTPPARCAGYGPRATSASAKASVHDTWWSMTLATS